MREMRKLFVLYRAQLLVSFRNRQAFFFSIIFPLIFVGVFGLAFQEGAPGNSTIPIGLVNLDGGLPEGVSLQGVDGSQISGKYFSERFVDILSSLKFEDNETKIFNFKSFQGLQDARTELEKQDIHALLVIPESFSLAMVSAMQQAFPNMTLQGVPQANTSVVLEGDQSLINFNIATTVVEQVLKDFVKFGQIEAKTVALQVEGNISSKGLTAFDLIVPGLVIFAVLNNLSTVAAVSVSDISEGMLDRLRKTKMKGYHYLGAIILAQISLAFIQIPIMFFAASLFGFPITKSIGYAFIVALLMALAVSGIGIIAGGLTENADAAGSLGAIIGVPMAFLAGSFFLVPNPTFFDVGWFRLRIFDFLPATPAVDMLRITLLNDKTIFDTPFEFAMLLFDAVLFLSIGLLIYVRKHCKAH